MKKVSLLFLAVLISVLAHAQKAQGIWYYYATDNSPAGYSIRKVTVSDKAIVNINTTDSEKNPMNYAVLKVVKKDGETRFITKDDFEEYNASVFYGISEKSANYFLVSGKATEEEAINTKVLPNNAPNYFTEAGLKEHEAKPALKNFTREDALSVVTMLEKGKSTIQKDPKIKSKEEKDLATMMLVLVVQRKWLEANNYHQYKSLAIFADGLDKFKDDEEVSRRMGAIIGQPVGGKKRK